ncbi:MAG: GNAT family N-acetyltransferase [Acidobacteria bacterium]|nr:GNAT family N-acetyltransferase [Acidobacteriota bacterium]
MRGWERNAGNLSASLSFYGPWEMRGGVKLITSPVTYSVFNIALLTDPVSDLEGEMERRIRIADAHYAAKQRQWSFWVCEDFLGARTARRILKIFENAGLVCIAESPGMETEEMVAPRRELPQLEYRRVEDRTTRSDFSRVVSQCFHIPTAIAQRIYESNEPWHAPLEIWLGYFDGYAVTSTAVIEAAGALGIYSVATLPPWRGRGMGEAIMRHAVGDLRQRGVRGPLVLQSSPAGLDLYRRLGFRRTTRYSVFATT